MSQSVNVIETLKSMMRSKGLTYKELGSRIGMSESGVKRAFSSKSLSLTRVEEICDHVGISLVDLVKQSELEDATKIKYLSEEQEISLASDEKLFAVFYFILSGFDFNKLVEKTSLSESEVEQNLVRLEGLQLLKVLPSKKIDLLSVQNPVWIERGPLSRCYEEQLTKEAVTDRDFTESGYRRFLFGYANKSQLQVFKDKMLRAEKEFMSSFGKHSKGTSMVAFYQSLSPWAFTVFEKYLSK